MSAGPEILGRMSGRAGTRRRGSAVAPLPVLPAWVRGQATNVIRHAAALRPFRPDEFGAGPASPGEAHIEAANTLIRSLGRGLLKMARRVDRAAERAVAEPTTANL